MEKEEQKSQDNEPLTNDGNVLNENQNSIEQESNEIVYFSLNQENNIIAIATKSGFKLFSADPFRLLYETNCGPINIVEMIYTSNLVLLVGLTSFGDYSPKKITIYSTQKNEVICSSYEFSGNINVAKINKNRMIIGERSYIHIYSTGDLKVLDTLNVGTGYVSLGKLILSANSDKNSWLCYSSSQDGGLVKIYDTILGQAKTPIKAHKSPILKMCLNFKGDLLATCSCKGTIIRIFSIPSGEKLMTYKRGINSAYIFYMNFSMSSNKLITTSDDGTLHIFDLKKEKENPNTTHGVAKFFNRAFVTVAGKMMPKDYEDAFGTEGASLYYKNNFLTISNLVSFYSDDESRAYCFTSDGCYYSFWINYDKRTITKAYETNIKDLQKTDNEFE